MATLDPRDAASAARNKRMSGWKDVTREAKRTKTAIGYEYRPYFNSPKAAKRSLCKLILVERAYASDGERVIDKTLRTLVARNFPMTRAVELAALPPGKITGKEHYKKQPKRAA